MRPIPLDDPADPRLAPYAAIRERDLVGRQGRFVAEGEVVLRVLLSGRSRFCAESVLLAPERLPALEAALAAAGDIPVYIAARPVMSAVAGFPIHRGVLAIGRGGPVSDPDVLVPDGPALLLGLVGLTNHDNVGGLFRNAAAFGADGVLMDGATCDPLYRKAIRVSAGTSLTVPYGRVPDGAALLDVCARRALVPVALAPGGEDIAALPPLPRALLLLGTEGTGLPEALMARARRVGIPMAPGVDSLNVAVAGAVALHRLGGGRLTSPGR
ncbi:TrmH family RNA methyltransferase [Methylobacterium oryzisoli]|uniref:TrmH family RNA methyltransferase n=1 Tax=Methylobacterium oryzisoli TaxID=3385502 RepID=UPI00389203BE